MGNPITREDFYIDDHAILFGLIARHCDRRLGKPGLDSCAKAVALMARERGLRSAMRCIANGDALDMRGFLCYSELRDPRGWNEARAAAYAPVYQTTALRCGWMESWKKYGLTAYSGLYCEGIDRNLLYGFNPNLRLQIGQCQAKGDASCSFHWLDCQFSGKEELEQVMEKRAGMLPGITKDFLYHSGHLLSAMRRILYLEHGLEAGKAPIEGALEEYASLFSPEKSAMLSEEAEQDFLRI